MGKIRSYNFVGRHTFETSLWIVVLIVFLILVTGCVSKPGNIVKNENITVPKSTVPPAPKQLFLHPNSSESFQFWSHNISISYLSTSPHLVELTIDGDTEIIEINHSTQCPGNHCSYYATRDNIDYSIKPVVWRYNEAGERIWSFETWNTSELYFEAHIRGIKR